RGGLSAPTVSAGTPGQVCRRRPYSSILRSMLRWRSTPSRPGHAGFRPLRYGVFVVPLVLLIVAVACSDDPAPTSPTPDASTGGGSVPEGVCPTIAPEPGEACQAPEGTTC